ncbi:Sorbitol dehydrogenase [Cyphellophora attinorum]|uniref:Sorbitol dehydrogenase n=1 Tax=Cyphellophora attinorum TaxID=1664694 RepID=A0A0N1NYG1_9EURO|nr:Sorbitol dehydrogenase [Phialophora attinorum]KPI38880.1 Sorbitol dehydrogenase [Phialophora attinorum]
MGEMASTESIRALVLHGAKDLRLESRETPKPQPNELTIAIRATGLCGSDLHYYNHGRNGNFVLQHPMCLGHESSGTITSTPSTTSTTTTSNLKEGDRVALEVGLPCRACPLCTTGRYNLCPKLRFKSSAKTHPHLDGTLQTVITHPADLCHKLPENVTFEQGALVEPLAVVLHAVRRSQGAGSGGTAPLVGSSALVLGAGAVGMLTAATLAVSGVSNIVIADIDGPRLEIAKGMAGGRFRLKTFLIPKKASPKDTEEALSNGQDLAKEVAKVGDLPEGFGFDRVYEFGDLCCDGGRDVGVGGDGESGADVAIGAAALREVDIIGVFRYANCYPAAIALFASGQLDGVAEALVSHRVGLEDGERAFRLAANAAREGEDEGRAVVKVLITS